MPEWRSGSATPLHGEGRRFNPVLGYQKVIRQKVIWMKTFTQFLKEARGMVDRSESRCTAVTCNALAAHHGVPEAKLSQGHTIGTGADLWSHLQKHGMKVQGLGIDHIGKTVKQFVKEHPTGAHYIMTHGHGMALINGKLHDAAERGPDGRKIQGSWEVTKA